MKNHRRLTKEEIKKYKPKQINKYVPYFYLPHKNESGNFYYITYGVKYIPIKLFINILILPIGCFIYGVSEYWNECITGLFNKFGYEDIISEKAKENE